MNFELNAKPKIQTLSILMSSKWGLIHYLEMLHFLFSGSSVKSPYTKFLKKKFLDAFDSSLFSGMARPLYAEFTANTCKGKVM